MASVDPDRAQYVLIVVRGGACIYRWDRSGPSDALMREVRCLPIADLLAGRGEVSLQRSLGRMVPLVDESQGALLSFSRGAAAVLEVRGSEDLWLALPGESPRRVRPTGTVGGQGNTG